MRLLLVRHGATANNLEERFTGQSDIPLSPLGQQQAECAAEALAAQRFDAIVTSDLRRAHATATAIVRRHSQPLIIDTDLREMSMGAWEGATLAEIELRDPAGLARWHAHPVDEAPPGGETVLACRDRLVGALERWRGAYPGGTVLWVTHGGAIGVLVCHLLGIDLARRWQIRRDNAAITELEVGDGYAIVHRLNEMAHLQDLGNDAEAERIQVI
jgi:broad specificity phosphatase PhoE